jgi:hypothetical protein
MRREFAIWLVLLLLPGIMPGQSNQDRSPNPQPTKQVQPALPSSKGENSQTNAGNEETKPNGIAPDRNTSSGWPQWIHDSNWWLVIIAGLTGGVIGWQSWETRKAAQGAKENAEAAFSQLQIIREKERARVGVDLEDLKLDVVPGPHTSIEVGWGVTLYGQTDAFIHGSQCFAEVEGQNLPEHLRPAWGEMVGLPSVISCDCRNIKGIVLVHPPRPYPFDYAALSDRLVSGEQTVVCVGFVEYSDVFGGSWIFRFKRRWNFFGTPDELGGLRPRSLLSGEWAKYGSPEDNGEYPTRKPKEPN